MVGVDTIAFNFGGQQVSAMVDADMDTLFWTIGNSFPVYDGQVRKETNFWIRYIGKDVIFLWNMKNHVDYSDAVQFMFGPQKGEFLIAQIVAMSSGIVLFSLVKG